MLLTDCRFDDGLHLTGARTDHSIRLTRCSLPSFTADRLHSRSDLELCGVTMTGEVSLVEMHLDGDLRCTKSVFENPKSAAVNGASMTVGGSVHFDDVQSTGAVNLASAQIKGDLDCRGSKLLNPEERSLDGTHLTVEGELIWEDKFEAEGEVCLRWAHLKALRGTGASLSAQHGCALDAEGLHVADDILLDGRFTALGEVRLLAARVENKLRFTQATLENSGGRALNAERIEARDVYLNQVQASGEIRLVGAEIHTQLNCTAAKFDRDSGDYALDAELLVCRGEVYLNNGFTAFGEVRLIGAEIKRELNCTRGTFENAAGIALHADGMTTEGSVFLNEGFKAVGQVRLARATVGRQLDCVDGAIQDVGGLALDLSGLVCKGDVKLSGGFHAVGTVKLEGAHITRDLDCKAGEFNATGTAFDAVDLHVGGSFTWQQTILRAGNVDLSFAFARILKDDKQSWPVDRRVILTGFAYESLNDLSIADRKTWLESTHDYSAQPYQQLAWLYQQKGQVDDAMEITVANHKDRRKRGMWGKKGKLGVRAAKSWDWFIGWTVRYGYQFHRPLLVLLTVGVINIGLFYAANYSHIMSPTTLTSTAPGPATDPPPTTPGPATDPPPTTPGPATDPPPTTPGPATDPPPTTPGPTTDPPPTTPGPTTDPPPTTPGPSPDHPPRSDKCDGRYPCFIPPVYAFEILIPVLNLRQINYWLPTPSDVWGQFLFAWVIINIVIGWVASIAIVGGLTYAFGGDRASGPQSRLAAGKSS
ncbi:hypothetical protein [Streptomyces lunaelactis]|uniref:hypothetical protein n=1 Tax=Streptomyces lunaelactis TaxID=1535768 RepID=UPI0015858E3C|nr:hypothetical protein [Streptomyces lunaelactis]